MNLFFLFFKKIYYLFLIFIVLWGIGFFIFIKNIPQHPSENLEKTAALIVVTGGPNRLSTALSLLEKGYSPSLFISGIKSTAYDLKPFSVFSAENYQKIFFGFRAKTTVGNALESQQWIRKNNIQSIRLITSAVHTQRCLLEFRRLLPDFKIIIHPVFATSQAHSDLIFPNFSLRDILMNFKTFTFVHREYFKYILALCYAQKLFGKNMKNFL